MPVEQKPSGGASRAAGTHSAPHVRSVRTSLPSSSQSRDVRISRGRYPSQSLEIYPKENSECESPSPAFPSSPPGFPHDTPLKSSADSVGKFPQPANDGRNRQRLEDESDSGTHSTDTSSLSGSSHGSGVKVSLIEHVRLDVRAHDRKEPHRTRLNVVPGRLNSAPSSAPNSTATSTHSGTNSSTNPCRYSGGYDNIANIKAAIIAAATAKLASSPPSLAENAAGRRPESLQLSIVSQSDSSARDSTPAAQSEKCITDRTDERTETLSKKSLVKVSSGFSDCTVKATGSNEQPGSQEVLAENPIPPAAQHTLVVSDRKGNSDVNVVCDRDLDSIPAVSSSTLKSDDITGSVEPSNPIEGFVENTLTCLQNDSGNTKEENSFTLIPESPLVEDCARTNIICSNKPPIGKSVPEPGKVIKSERKSVKPDKKSSEPAAASFKSLLGRSRSPSPKGRAGNSGSTSSTKESRAEHLNQAIVSLLLQTETDENQDSGEKVRAHSEDDNGSIVVSRAEQTDTAEKSFPNDSGESPENPWRVNLRQSLRPNLENFKGEKVFTKDTVTTTVFIGIGLDGSCTSPWTRSEVSGKEPSTLQAKASRSFPRISDSARDLRIIQSSEQPAHADVDFGYISDSGLSVAKDSGKIGRFCRQKGKKSVTFAEEYYGKGSSILETNPRQLSPDISPDMAQNMDRVVEGRSPTEKVSISENVKTYLEMVNSSWQKGNPAGDEVEPASESQANRTKNQNGFCEFETHDVKKSKSEIIESEFNNNSSNGSDIEQFGNGKVKGTEERQSVGLDDLDFDDLGASQQDLKQLYQLQRSERLEEQRRAEVEKQRLEEILKMCSEFGVNTDLEKREPNPSTDRSKTLNSSSSNSEDDAAERNTIKRRPVFDKSIPATSQILDPSPIFRLESSLSDSRASSATAGGRAAEEDLSPASPVVDSGIDISSADRPFVFPHLKEFGSTFRDRRSSEERRPSLDRSHLEDWSTGEFPSHLLTNDTEYLKSGYPGKRIFHKVSCCLVFFSKVYFL